VRTLFFKLHSCTKVPQSLAFLNYVLVKESLKMMQIIIELTMLCHKHLLLWSLASKIHFL